MADNVLAQVPRKRYPTLDEQMRSDIVNYLSRLKSDFVTSGERAGQGLGQVIDDGNYLEGVPRVVLGGLGALSAPVSAAVSPVLGPLLQPVGEAVDTYVGQPVERATGYPADITNELFLTGVTAGAAPVLRPVLRGSGNFLAKVGDAAEAGLNRVGYTARPQAGTFFSGGGPVKLADDVAQGGGLLQQSADVGSGVGLRPNAGEAIDATNSVFRAHPADSQVTGNMRLSPTMSSANNLQKPGAISVEEIQRLLEDIGLKDVRYEHSSSIGSPSQYLYGKDQSGNLFKVRLSDHNYLSPEYGADIRYGTSAADARRAILSSARDILPPHLRSELLEVQQKSAEQFAADVTPKIESARATLLASKGQRGLDELESAITNSDWQGVKKSINRLRSWGVLDADRLVGDARALRKMSSGEAMPPELAAQLQGGT